MKPIRMPFNFICVFIWIGFVCSISFMEAWLKFYAPGVTLPIGVGIGRLIFNILNKVEWVFAIVILTNALSRRKNPLIFYIPFVILIIQTFMLLPALSERADLIIEGREVQPSLLHVYYLSLEFVKVISLFIFGINSIERLKTTSAEF